MRKEPGDWYLFYTGSNREKKCERLLKSLLPTFGAEDYVYETYIPTEETKMPDGKIVQSLLYPGYIFVRMDNYSNLKPLFRRVSNLKLYPAEESVAPLSREEVDGLMRIKFKPEAPKEEMFSLDQEVRVVSGIFENFTGRIRELHPTKQTATLLVNLFGRETPVELSYAELEKVK